MIYELSQKFFFEAAHTLDRSIDAAGSRRIHGHTYHTEVTLMGAPDARSGMLQDLGDVRRHIESVRELLDHQFLDEVPELGPATLVAPIDKLSVVLVALFGVVFLGERPSLNGWVGIALIAAGAVLIVIKR